MQPDRQHALGAEALIALGLALMIVAILTGLLKKEESMPFRIERSQSKGMPPLVLVRETDGDFMWDARARNATLFDGDEADAIVAQFKLDDAEPRGVRNSAE